MIKAIIFDCFGVIVGEGLWKTFVRAGGDLDKSGEFLNEKIKLMNSGKISSDEFHHEIAEHLGLSYEAWKVIDNEAELPNTEILKYISAEIRPAYKVGLLSNASIGSVEKRLSSEQLDLFDVRIISAEVGLMKPDPEIFLLAAKKLGVEPEECLSTDDHSEYLTGAESVGMRAVLFEDLDRFKEVISSLA